MKQYAHLFYLKVADCSTIHHSPLPFGVGVVFPKGLAQGLSDPR